MHISNKLNGEMQFYEVVIIFYNHTFLKLTRKERKSDHL